jgi:hypothetical protein
MAAKNLIGGYGDLGIYLDVAREFRSGGFDLCRDRSPAGPWVYPHFAALPFAGLEALLGDAGARWSWCLLLGVATALLLRSLVATLAPFGGLRWWQWLLFGVLFHRCIAQNLTHGQLSLWVGTLATMGVAQLQRGREFRAGLWLGVAAALKLTPLLFAPALFAMRAPRAALSLVATFAVAVLLVPWPFCGTEEHVRHLVDLWRTITESFVSPERAAIVRGHSGPSIGGTLDYLLQARAVNRDGYMVNVVDLTPQALLAVKLAWSSLIAGLLGAWFWRARLLPESQRLVAQSAAVLLATAFFAPLVRVYHLAAVLLPFALFCRGPRPGRDVLWWTAAVATLFSMTLRQKALLGEALWKVLDHGGLLHFAMVTMLIWLVRDGRPSASESTPARLT